MYRSDAATAPVEPARIPLPANAPRLLTAMPPAVQRQADAPPAAAPLSVTRGWIESGLYVMTWPVAITAAIMFAPVAWMLSRRR